MTLESALAAYHAARGNPSANWAAIAALLAGAVPKPRKKAVRKRGQPWPCYLVTFSDGWRCPASGLTEADAHELARERYEWRCGRTAPEIVGSIRYEDAGRFFDASETGDVPEPTVRACQLELPADEIAAKWKARARQACVLDPPATIWTDAMLASVEDNKRWSDYHAANKVRYLAERDARMAARGVEEDARQDAEIARIMPMVAACRAKGFDKFTGYEYHRHEASFDDWYVAWEAFDDTTAIAA